VDDSLAMTLSDSEYYGGVVEAVSVAMAFWVTRQRSTHKYAMTPYSSTTATAQLGN
jgi:hypothetical protein